MNSTSWAESKDKMNSREIATRKTRHEGTPLGRWFCVGIIAEQLEIVVAGN